MARAEFSRSTQEVALSRQGRRCGSCGESIHSLGEAGRSSHRFGEIAHAHHILHCQQGGSRGPENCVILCEACHYSAHEGGNYQSKSVTADASMYPYYRSK